MAESDETYKKIVAAVVESQSWTSRVGASSLGNSCSRCLAEALAGDAEKRDPAIAPYIGTAVHKLLELTIEEKLPEIETEQRLIVGETPHYGPIRGVVDVYDPTTATVLDYKIIGKSKIGSYVKAHNVDNYTTQAGETLMTYVRQLMLYGKGIEDKGGAVEWVGLVLIPRDDATKRLEDSFTYLPYKYDRSIAEKTIERAVAIDEWLAQGGNHSEVDSAKGCYVCSRLRQ